MRESRFLYGSILCFLIALIMACVLAIAVRNDCDSAGESKSFSVAEADKFRSHQSNKKCLVSERTQSGSMDKRLLPPVLEHIVVENEGVFELPIEGSHGIALDNLRVYRNAEGDDYEQTVQAGTPFTVLKDENECARVLIQLAGGSTGWVNKDYIMINLPDIIPSIIYKNSNAESSLMRNLGMPIEGITGETLYGSRVYNNKLGWEEYIMPVQYHMAEKIMEAQRLAKEQGLCIVLYEGFRPLKTQIEVADAMKAMAAQNKSTRASIQKDGFNIAFYINTKVSNHQMGCAVDVSLAKVSEWKNVSINGNIVPLPCSFEEFRYGEIVPDTENGVWFGKQKYGVIQDSDDTSFQMPTPIHELSYLSGTFTGPTKTYTHGAWKKALNNGAVKRAKYWTAGAQTLQDIFVQAGMDPLASEWWHFNDIDAWALAQRTGAAGDFEVGLTSFSMTPAEAVALIDQG